MAFFFLNVFTFIMFFQPVSVFPVLGPFRPYRYSALLAFVTFILLGVKSRVPVLSTSTTQFYLLFVLMQVLSSASIWLHGGLATFQEIWLNFVIVYILIVKSCIDEKKTKSIVLMIVLGIVYLSFTSVSDVIQNIDPDARPMGFGWYELPNDLVLILSCVIPLAVCLFELSNSFLMKIFFLAAGALFTINILLSASRGGLLGLLAVGSLSLLVMKKIPGFVRYSMIGILIAAVLTIGLTAVFNRSDLIPGQLTGDDSSEHRFEQWAACLRMVKDHPFLGVGPGEAVYNMREYGGIRGLVPHNTLIQVFAETGIPGGIFFILCTIYPLVVACRFFIKNKGNLDRDSVVLYKYLVISLVGFWICAFLSNRVYFSILYVLIALIVATRENILKNQDFLFDR